MLITHACIQLLGTSKAYGDYKMLSHADFVTKSMKSMKAELAPQTMESYERHVGKVETTLLRTVMIIKNSHSEKVYS